MEILPGTLVLLVIVVGSEAHDTFPDYLWPLTTETGMREVLLGRTKAQLSGTTVLVPEITEPRLGYPALQLTDDIKVGITVTDEFTPKDFMLMAMFHFNPSNSERLYFFSYTDTVSGARIFDMYSKECYIYVSSETDVKYDRLEGSYCPRKDEWYTMVISWESKKMKVYMVLATSSGDGETVLDFEAKTPFEELSEMPTSGNLTVGGTPDGGGAKFAVCCLRIYQERFDSHHVESDMWEDCQPEAYWVESKENPCRGRPCQNGGWCTPNADATDHQCTCRPWFAGRNCQTERWMAHVSFRMMGHMEPTRLAPMEKAVNVSAWSWRECGTFCLRENLCLSFTYTTSKLCTLYDDYTTDISSNPNYRYYVPKADTTD